MCGIIACRTNRPATDYLSTALRRLEYRGYDSIGVALTTSDGEVTRLRTVGRIAALERLVRDWSGPPFDGVGLGHTRWATHGAVTEANAHPHADCTGRINLVHNGIIENVIELRAELIREGHQIVTPVDSEVLSHLIEHELQRCDDLFEAVQSALTRVHGSWALAVLEQRSGRVVVAAHRSPLLIAHSSHGCFAASDFAAISDWTDEFRVLEDGDVVDLGDNRRWNRHGVAALPPALTRCAWRGGDADLNGYTDYMAKEIDEQPEAAARVLDGMADRIATGELWAELGLKPFERLRVIGCGTSLNAGRIIGNLACRLGGIPVTASVASEVAEEAPETGVLCLAISQSGETADVLNALESDSVAQTPLAVLTNNPHSTLARRANAIIECCAGPEIGVAATKTFVCQVVAGAALMISALVAMDRLSVAHATRLVGELRQLPDQLASAITTAKCGIPPIADEFATASGFVFLARGSGLPYAAEGALKLQELTYRWAEHYPAGELKHGPLALIGPGTPVVVVDNGDRKLGGNIAEVQARGGRVISVGPVGSSIVVTRHPAAPWGPLESVVPMQILARDIALCLGHDVDKPRNLAKSVTVE